MPTTERMKRLAAWLTEHGVDPGEVAEHASFHRAETGMWTITNPPEAMMLGLPGRFQFTEVKPYPRDPQTWSIDPEPGPEVKAVRDRLKQLWVRDRKWWTLREDEDGNAVRPDNFGTHQLHWKTLMVANAPLTDATGEVDA